jgi:hypothetical protein
LEDVQGKIAKGYPVWISYGPLRESIPPGTPEAALGNRGKGHIAVIRGFTRGGDIILNDPWGDPADAFGNIKGAGSTVSGFFDYNIGNGDNTIIKAGKFKEIALAKLNQTLVIEYPHVWSFPVRDSGEPGKPFRFSRHDTNEKDGIQTLGQRKTYRDKQAAKMLDIETVDNACYPATDVGRWHDGIHIARRAGAPVYAAGPGRVVTVKAVETKPSPESASSCFALVRHFFSPDTGGKEFFSLYMNLAPVNIAERLRLRFSFGESMETGDWLDQIIQHIQPMRILVRPAREDDGREKPLDGILDARMPSIYRSSDSSVETGKLGQREMIFLCPIDREFYHEGVDFNGSIGTNIISFIEARVIDCGWTESGYGNVLILANARGKGIYLLGHLNEFINTLKPGSIVQPGMIVAKVGTTGRSTGPHLHVSYYDREYTEGQNIIIKSNNTIRWDKDFDQGSFLRNPFKHDEEKRKNIPWR